MKESVSDKAARNESILRDKPLLVTLSNPEQTIGPLWPENEGSPGWRVWQMMHKWTGASSNQYLRTFERRCLSDNVMANSYEVSVEYSDRFLENLQGRSRVIFVGYDSMIALGIMTRKYDYRWRLDYGFTYASIPFPSASNKYYFDPIEIALTGVFLADVYIEALQKRRVVIP